jgi:hypothetical protein
MLSLLKVVSVGVATSNLLLRSFYATEGTKTQKNAKKSASVLQWKYSIILKQELLLPSQY